MICIPDGGTVLPPPDLGLCTPEGCPGGDTGGGVAGSPFRVSSVAECPSGMVVAEIGDLPAFPQPVDPADVLYVVSWGFGLVVFLWFLGYCIGVGLKVIRKV